MACKAQVLYANDTDITFDLEYYISSHMPLVWRTWKKHGLQNWDVVQFGEDASGTWPPFHVQATLTFTDGAALESALADSDTGAIFGDVPNFTNKSPIFVAGKIVASS